MFLAAHGEHPLHEGIDGAVTAARCDVAQDTGVSEMSSTAAGDQQLQSECAEELLLEGEDDLQLETTIETCLELGPSLLETHGVF